MKVAVLPVLLILAGAFASPPQFADNRDIVTDFIHNLILRIREFIKDSGWDPVELERFAYEYSGDLLQFKFHIDDLFFFGASNIVVNRLFNNVILSTFDFDVAFTELGLRIGDSGLEVAVGDIDVSGELSGWLSIKNIRLAGEVRYEGNIITGVNIVGIELANSIDSIEANVHLIANGNDYSERVNTFLNDKLPNTLDRYKNEINAAIARIIMAIINRPRAF